MSEVSGNLTEREAQQMAQLVDLMADKNTDLHPDLVPYVEESDWGPMLRAPLVYSIPLTLPGLMNRQYQYKVERLAEAVEEGDWHTAVFLHERAWRLDALITYVTGRYDDGSVVAMADLTGLPNYEDIRALVAEVWVDSENIEQRIADWRALICNGEGIWLGTEEERAEFEALDRIHFSGRDHIKAYRGGSVGDWSWTTDRKIAEFFSRRSGMPVRCHNIPVDDVFGYLTRRSEAELLVRFTPFRARLVYPDGTPPGGLEFLETEEG